MTGSRPWSFWPPSLGPSACCAATSAKRSPYEREALADIPEDAVWALAPRMVLASGLWWSGQVGEAVAVLDGAIRVARRAEIPVDLAYALGLRAAIALEVDDEPAAEALVRERDRGDRQGGS